jgi:hypothetical protein
VTISDDACSSAWLDQGGFSQAILIRMEDYGRENLNDRDLEVDSCTILQNYAASLLYQNASCRQGKRSTSKSCKTACKLLRLCLNMLDKRYTRNVTANASSGDLDVLFCHRMVTSAYIATYSLIQASLLRRKRLSSTVLMNIENDCFERLHQLYIHLQILDAPCEAMTGKAAAAA